MLVHTRKRKPLSSGSGSKAKTGVDRIVRRIQEQGATRKNGLASTAVEKVHDCDRTETGTIELDPNVYETYYSGKLRTHEAGRFGSPKKLRSKSCSDLNHVRHQTRKQKVQKIKPKPQRANVNFNYHKDFAPVLTHPHNEHVPVFATNDQYSSTNLVNSTVSVPMPTPNSVPVLTSSITLEHLESPVGDSQLLSELSFSHSQDVNELHKEPADRALSAKFVKREGSNEFVAVLNPMNNKSVGPETSESEVYQENQSTQNRKNLIENVVRCVTNTDNQQKCLKLETESGSKHKSKRTKSDRKKKKKRKHRKRHKCKKDNSKESNNKPSLKAKVSLRRKFKPFIPSRNPLDQTGMDTSVPREHPVQDLHVLKDPTLAQNQTGNVIFVDGKRMTNQDRESMYVMEEDWANAKSDMFPLPLDIDIIKRRMERIRLQAIEGNDEENKGDLSSNNTEEATPGPRLYLYGIYGSTVVWREPWKTEDVPKKKEDNTNIFGSIDDEIDMTDGGAVAAMSNAIASASEVVQGSLTESSGATTVINKRKSSSQSISLAGLEYKHVDDNNHILTADEQLDAWLENTNAALEREQEAKSVKQRYSVYVPKPRFQKYAPKRDIKEKERPVIETDFIDTKVPVCITARISGLNRKRFDEAEQIAFKTAILNSLPWVRYMEEVVDDGVKKRSTRALNASDAHCYMVKSLKHGTRVKVGFYVWVNETDGARAARSLLYAVECGSFAKTYHQRSPWLSAANTLRQQEYLIRQGIAPPQSRDGTPQVGRRGLVDMSLGTTFFTEVAPGEPTQEFDDGTSFRMPRKAQPSVLDLQGCEALRKLKDRIEAGLEITEQHLRLAKQEVQQRSMEAELTHEYFEEDLTQAFKLHQLARTEIDEWRTVLYDALKAAEYGSGKKPELLFTSFLNTYSSKSKSSLNIINTYGKLPRLLPTPQKHVKRKRATSTKQRSMKANSRPSTTPEPSNNDIKPTRSALKFLHA